MRRVELDARIVFGDRKADHRILNAALAMSVENPKRKVILVTKDVNLRLKAKSLGLQAEDYETGKIKDLDTLYTGNSTVDGVSATLIDQLYTTGFVPYKKLFKEKAACQPLLHPEEQQKLGAGIL